MNRNRIVSAIFACLLVTAGVAGPMSQPAVAAEAGECSALDDFVMFATLGAVNVEDCSREAYVQDAIADYEQTDAEQTKVDIYSEGNNVKAGADAYRAPFDNYVNDTETVAWSKMQVAVAEAYQNGSTESQARYQAEKAIEEYYAVKQRNLIAQWNQHVTAIERMRDTASMEDSVSTNFVDAHTPIKTNSNELGDDVYNINGFENKTITLVNGTDVTVRVISIDDNSGSQHDTASIDTSISNYNWRWIGVDAPTSSYDNLLVMDRQNYLETWNRIPSLNNGLVSEAETFVNSTYADFDSGDANASDVISANTAMFEYGTRSGSENESLYNTVGALALMGFDTPDLQQSGTMDVTYQNTTYTGILLARNAPNGSWTANTTYDPSTITGPVMLATTDGQKIDLTSNFTVNAMRAKDGSQLQSINTTQYAYKTANSTELMEMQSELTALRQEIEDRQSSGGAGGGSGGFGGNTMLIVLAALAAGALALGSQNGGGGNNRYRR